MSNARRRITASENIQQGHQAHRESTMMTAATLHAHTCGREPAPVILCAATTLRAWLDDDQLHGQKRRVVGRRLARVERRRADNADGREPRVLPAPCVVSICGPSLPEVGVAGQPQCKSSAHPRPQLAPNLFARQRLRPRLRSCSPSRRLGRPSGAIACNADESARPR